MPLANTDIYDDTADLTKRIERYWDTRSEDFASVRRRELTGANARLWRELLTEHLPHEQKLKILDIGTGAGFFAVLLAQAGHEVTGIDMSEKMLAQAQKNLSLFGCRAVLRKMNAQATEFADEAFDAVISRNLTWTLPDVMAAYREWRRILKPQGMLLNFDADRGEATFIKKDDKNDVHANIRQELIRECNDIKDRLRISTHRRPTWDAAYLAGLGFAVQYDDDVAQRVCRDENLRFDDAPLFGIYARKT